MPERYFPDRTPRPKADQAISPIPWALRAGQDLPLDTALQQGVLHLRTDRNRASRCGALPRGDLRRLPAA